MVWAVVLTVALGASDPYQCLFRQLALEYYHHEQHQKYAHAEVSARTSPTSHCIPLGPAGWST